MAADDGDTPVARGLTDDREQDPRAVQAARNNAAWCDAVCRAHGGATEFSAGLWRNRSASPPVYPNVIALDPSVPFATRDTLLQELGA